MKALRILLGIVTMGILLGGAACQEQKSCEQAKKSACAKEGDIKLGLQLWTFNRLTFVEALDQAQKLGVHYVQAYRNQKLGEGFGADEKFHHTMKPESFKKLQELAKSKGITIASYGVITGTDEADWRQIFAFAKMAGMKDISSEPKVDSWPVVMPLIEKLSKEYGVAVGLHNHENPFPPSKYVERLNQYSKTIGFCPDTGHWPRSGFEPVASLKALQGRIVSVHADDVVEMKSKAESAPFGMGVGDVAGQLAELKRQGFKGIYYIEYEKRAPVEEKAKDVADCVTFFRRAIGLSIDELREGKALAAGFVGADDVAGIKRKGDSGKWPMPRPLFKEDLSNAEFKAGTWEMKDGVLAAKGGGDIWTKESFRNFAVSVEFKCAEKSNSGVFLRCGDTNDWLNNSLEVQILQGDAENATHVVGSLFDCMEPARQIEIVPGKWHHFVIILKDQSLRVFLDDERVLDAKLGQWKEPGKNPDGTPNKFTKAIKDMPKEGRIGFQYHNSPIEFRNMTVENLGK